MEKQDLLSSSLFSRIVGIMRYAIVIDKASLTNAAYILDLPGWVATGANPEETETLMREAIELHLEGLQVDGQPLFSPPTGR